MSARIVALATEALSDYLTARAELDDQPAALSNQGESHG